MIYKKKKVFAEIQTDFLAKIGNLNAFSGRITASISQLRHPNSFGGGAVFIFSTKLGLKSTKNVRFCILYRPMGLSISCKLDALYKKIFTLFISSYSESCYLNILLIMLLLECFLASLQSENTTSADQHCHYLQNFFRVITQNY